MKKTSLLIGIVAIIACISACSKMNPMAPKLESAPATNFIVPWTTMNTTYTVSNFVTRLTNTSGNLTTLDVRVIFGFADGTEAQATTTTPDQYGVMISYGMIGLSFYTDNNRNVYQNYFQSGGATPTYYRYSIR
jgi:hypothetical protein